MQYPQPGWNNPYVPPNMGMGPQGYPAPGYGQYGGYPPQYPPAAAWGAPPNMVAPTPPVGYGAYPGGPGVGAMPLVYFSTDIIVII